MPKVGAHVSAAGSLELSFERAQKIEAECMQIFISPPQQWVFTKHSDEEIAAFRKAQEETKVGPNFIHGTYLINLAAETPEHLNKSIEWLTYALNLADKLGIKGVIFHTGSHKGVGVDKVAKQVAEAIKKVLASSPLRSNNKQSLPPYDGSSSSSEQSESRSNDLPYLILENAANPNSIGYQFSDLGKILKLVGDERLKVCLDTQHCFGSGYGIETVLGLKDMLKEFDEEIGLSNLAAIHANDSKVEFKSNKDRHENIGEGFIGKEGFTNIINNPQLKEVPFLLEVPGFTDSGPDLENVKMLKSLRS